jgi:hypothetical protein
MGDDKKQPEPLTADELKFLYNALEGMVMQGNQKQLVPILEKQMVVMGKLKAMLEAQK